MCMFFVIFKQQQLIKQLQEQHYQQYMAQVYAQQARAQGMTPDGTTVPVIGQQDPEAGGNNAAVIGGPPAVLGDPNLAGQLAKLKVTNEKDQNDDTDVSDEEPGDDLPSNPAISPASMWTRQDCVDFKNEIKKVGEGIIKVGHGETVTVRVPTHEEGNSLFWEFATDYYDIGFGVLFEWTVSDTNEVRNRHLPSYAYLSGFHYRV
ncbi:hypothetical protein L596_011256 [Steinernema carpocapsae]|uniref:GOLD domain-containing protein n=1 Tax=Steinernema carpocapsae TaxID=34508 RepID=A0A4U5NT91_STECR|nr:hypothetical protein L596_011256 [Steinernema carpocapsae]